MKERVAKADLEQEVEEAPARKKEGDVVPMRAQAPLTPRENRERALLGMCIAAPRLGKDFVGKLSEEHMSQSGRPALAWLRDHLDDPMEGLPREDTELVSVITELKMRAERDPPPTERAMELNFLLLEQRRVDDGIAAARREGDLATVGKLSREGSELSTRISHTESFGT